MPLDPNIILSGLQQQRGVDMNALLQQKISGMENINALERQRKSDELVMQDRAAAQAKEQEAAAIKALLPAYTYGIQTGDIAGAGNLAPPEMRDQLQPFIDALTGKSPQEVQAALIGSLASSGEVGQEALAAIQRAQTFGVQARQAKTAEDRLALDVERQAAELAAGNKVASREVDAQGNVHFFDAYGNEIRVAQGAGKPAASPAATDGVKLGPDQRMREDGTVEIVPGTKTYNAAAKSHASDKKDASIVVDKIASAQDKLDYILDPKNKDGFEYNFGGYYAAYAGQNMPVESAQNMYAKLESLKADLKGAGLEQLRAGGSIGQITEAEWPIIEKQIDSITPYMGEQAAREALMAIKQRLDNIAERATEAYDTQWGDTQFYSPVKAKTTGGGGGGGGGGGVREGATATNPQTGERIIYRNGQWQPL